MVEIDKRNDTIVALKNSGRSIRDIATELRMSHTRVHQVLRKHEHTRVDAMSASELVRELQRKLSAE
jgi:Mor family transcriptional regulator